MQIALCQYDIAWEDRDANLHRIDALLDAHRPTPGSLVVLPELCTSGFSMNVAAIAEGDDSPSEAGLAVLSRRYGCGLLGSVPRRHDGKVLNEALLIDAQGKPLLRYAKRHPFTFAGEDRHYAHGDGMGTFTWQDAVVAPLICYDLRFPELARSLVRCGATVLIYVANFPASREAHWLALLVARAIENQAFVVGVNRCGSDPNVRYNGRSLIVDPQGAVLADAGSEEAVVTADLAMADVHQYRAAFPALADIRDDDWVPPGRMP